MQQTVYLEFDQDDEAVDLSSVKLASASPSDAYGILDMTTGIAVVAYGTVVASNPVGTYSHTFDVENGHLYFVSWEIIANAGETPTYKTDQVGPTFSVDNKDIRATATYVGKTRQATTATLMLKITNFDGNPIDAESIDIDIYDKNSISVILTSDVPEHVSKGYYVYDWVISPTQAVGEYTIVWNYVADDIQKAEIQNIIISEKSANTDDVWYSGRELEFKIALEHHIACSQSIPVYFEQAIPSRDNKVYHFSFKNWNQSSGVRIYRNDVIVNSGVEIDYFKGFYLSKTLSA